MKPYTNTLQSKIRYDSEVHTSKQFHSGKTTIYVKQRNSDQCLSKTLVNNHNKHRCKTANNYYHKMDEKPPKSFEDKLYGIYQEKTEKFIEEQCEQSVKNKTEEHGQVFEEPTRISQDRTCKKSRVPGHRTPEDIARMPTCVLNQLSHDRRFEKLRERSDRNFCDFDGKQVDRSENKAPQRLRLPEDNLFNPEFNFPNMQQARTVGRSLLESIRNTVKHFVGQDDNFTSDNNSDWDLTSDKEISIKSDRLPKFPKETRNAAIGLQNPTFPRRKVIVRCKQCREFEQRKQDVCYKAICAQTQTSLCSISKSQMLVGKPHKDNKKEKVYDFDPQDNRLEVKELAANDHIFTECVDGHKTIEDQSCLNSELNNFDKGDKLDFECVNDLDQDSSIMQEDCNKCLDDFESKNAPINSDTFKNYDMIPCPRNLLCDQGLHSGKCPKDVRSKLITPICIDNDCVCRRTESNEELQPFLWPGRVVRNVLKVSTSNDSIETSVTETFSNITVSEGIEKQEYLELCCSECRRIRQENKETEANFTGSDDEEEDRSNSLFDDHPSTSSFTPTHPHPYQHTCTMNGMNGHNHHHHHHSNHSNGDMNGSGAGIIGGDIITQNQQKGCWTIGLINSKFRYLTAETFGFKINANGASLKKKQIWTLEPVSTNSSDSVIYLRSHLDKYLAVDSFGNVTCESEEKDPGSKFQISVADDGSGRWALKNVVRGYFLGSSADKLTCTAKVPSDAEFWHVHLAARPQMNLRSVGRKRFAHLSENLDEIHVDANIPWGEDTLFTLEFRLEESGKYAIHTCNNKYLSLGGKLVDQCTKDCLFSAEYHSGQLALRDRAGSYLSPIGSKAVLKTRSNTVTRDELFSLEDSLPQASFVANLNARFVSVKQGVDVTANQDEISDHETFQLEFDWTTKRWYIRTMQDRYWTLETGGGIQASGDKRSSNALFDLAWQSDGSVAFRANNGRYVITKRSGHLYATADSVEDNSKYYFYLINRPILVLKCEQGFVGYKSSASSKLECNKATYECIQVERGDKGIVYFKGQNGKYWHVDSEGVTADSDSQEGFHLELREPTRLCIKSTAGNYLAASKNGLFRLGDSNFESATQWEY